METENRLSSLSLIQEARQKLRSYLTLETALMERIRELPEDNGRCSMRESLQLGAGWAYRQPTSHETNSQAIYDAFFATKPKQWNLSEDHLAWERQHVVAVAQMLQDGEDLELHQLDMRIDVSTAQELVAFVEGFMITSDYFAGLSYNSPAPAAESA